MVLFVDWISSTKRKWIICIEWLKNCAYWNWKEVRSFLAKWDLQEVCFDGCVIGLRARSGELLKKPWTVCTNDHNHFVALRGLKCTNTGNVLTDHIHAECRGIDCKESEKYTFSCTRKVHKAFGKILKNIMLELFLSVHHLLTIDTSCFHHAVTTLFCICMSSQSAELTVSSDPTVCTFASCGAARVGRAMKGRQHSPDHRRRRSDRTAAKMERVLIPRSIGGGSSQDSCNITITQLAMPMSGLRTRVTINFTPYDATLNATAYHWIYCPDPPLIQEVTPTDWNPLGNGECWDHQVPWSFGPNAEKVTAEYAKDSVLCYDYHSCLGFQLIIQIILCIHNAMKSWA